MAANLQLNLSFPEKDIAVLTLDDPDSSANVLSRHALQLLAGHLDTLDKRPGLQGLVITSSQPGMFIAGADLKEFAASLDAPKSDVISLSRQGQQLFGRLSKSSYVTVAAIDGICVGGGAELSIWCDRRVFSTGEKTAYGFPEVKLGLFPGWGGTARTPRMIGLSNAVELVTSGENIDPRAAAALGLANDVVTIGGDRDLLVAAAIRMIRQEQASGDFRRDRERWSGPISISDTELGFLGATASAYIQGQTKGHYPAPLAALELMLGAAGVDLETACQMEAEEFAKLFGSPINRAALNVFFLTDRNKKDPGVAKGVAAAQGRVGGRRRRRRHGAGDRRRQRQARHPGRHPGFERRGARPRRAGRAPRSRVQQAAQGSRRESGGRARAAGQRHTLRRRTRHSDVIVEAIIEKADAKQQLFARLEPQMRDDAILASNTSTIPITELAEELEHPERFCGLHFFNPVRQMPLVEVIRGKKTSDDTIATAVAYAKSIGKSPIVVNDGPGFLVNRLLLPYMNEAALHAHRRGRHQGNRPGGQGLRHADGADHAVRRRRPRRRGPRRPHDARGIPRSRRTGRDSSDALRSRPAGPEGRPRLLRLRAGQGRQAAARHRQRRGRPPASTNAAPATSASSRPRKSPTGCSCRCCSKRPASSKTAWSANARDVDLALIFGIGFPPFKGGLFFWADPVGPEKIVDKLKPYASLGKRFEPTKLLIESRQSEWPLLRLMT